MQIFISYSSADRETVRELASDLELLGYTVWFDQQIPGGRNWWNEILDQIRQSDLFISALSTRSLRSEACRAEYDYACALVRPIIPVALEELDYHLLSADMMRMQIVDYRYRGKEEILRLARAIRFLPPTTVLPTPLPLPPPPPLALSNLIRNQIGLPELTSEQQAEIIEQFYNLLEDRVPHEDIRQMLTTFQDRHDLSHSTSQEIRTLLEQMDSVRLEPRQIMGHEGCIYGLTFSPDGFQILSCSADHSARLWDAMTGQEIRRFVGHENAVVTAEFSPDSQMILTGSWDNTSRLWDIASGQEIRIFRGHSEYVRATFVPDGNKIVTGSSDRNIILWETHTGRKIRGFVGHQSHVLSVSVSPDSKYLLSAGDDHTIRLWDLATGVEINCLQGHTGSVRAIFSPNGKYILSGSDDGIAQLWDAVTGDVIRQYIEHTCPIQRVRFSPDGSYVLTCDVNNTVILWDMSSGRMLRKFTGHTSGVWDAAMSRNNRYVITGGEEKKIRLFVV